jgi:hypothetical protein
VDVVSVLAELGGVASGTELRAATSPGRVRRAVTAGRVVRASRNRYRLPVVDEGLAAAAALHGQASHLSAALVHGWEVAFPPEQPRVTVPRGRKVDRRRAAGIRVHTSRTPPSAGSVTDPARTVLDCARELPFAQALAVADSALRHRAVAAADLRKAAAVLRGAGAARVRRVVAAADGRAANPFESVLRALAIEEGLAVVPQVPVRVGDRDLHPDLLDPQRGLVLEADSWTWHAGKEAHDRDCARYNAFVLQNLRVLRFTWQQVMLSPAYVRHVLREAVHSGRTEPPAGQRHAA